MTNVPTPDWQRMWLVCPLCSGRLHVTEMNGVRLWCQRAIGEAYFDRDTGRNLFQPGDIHSRVEWARDDPRIAAQIREWQAKEAARTLPYRRLMEAQAA